MAVARITASKRWHKRVASLMTGTGRRELERAAERRGLTAELGADEVRELARLLPNDQLVIKALGELRRAEAGDLAKRARIQELLRSHRMRR